jgi:hypothetical protein
MSIRPQLKIYYDRFREFSRLFPQSYAKTRTIQIRAA